MKYGNLETTDRKNRRRAGRGISAGQGKTAGRGTKGQNSRAGSSRRIGFEGGQNPLYRRLPKLRGFKSHQAAVEIITTGQLEILGKAAVDSRVLAEAGLLSSPHVNAKLVVKGELKKKVAVKLPAASAGAVTVVEKAGGSFTKTERLARQKQAKDKQPAKSTAKV